MVNARKTKKEACGAKDCKNLTLPRMTQCKKLTLPKGTQYKKGKGTLCVQGKPKPVLNKKAKTTKKMLLQLQCQNCTFFFS